MSDIVIYKLNSGEEIIGELVSSETETSFIKNAAVVMLQRTEQGVGVALMPYMPYCDGSVKFFKSCIIAQGEPSQNMINEYNRIYGSGIQIAPASALVGLQ